MLSRFHDLPPSVRAALMAGFVAVFSLATVRLFGVTLVRGALREVIAGLAEPDAASRDGALRQSRRSYRTYLYVSAFLFIVALPAILIALPSAVAAVVHRAMANDPVLQRFSVLAIVVLSGMFALGVLAGLRAPTIRERNVVEVERADASVLFAWLDELGRRLRFRGAPRVLIGPYADLAVSAERPAWNEITGTRTWTLDLGVVALDGMDEREARAAIAHACVRYARGHSAELPLVSRVANAIAMIVQPTGSLWRDWNPARVYVWAFGLGFSRLLLAHAFMESFEANVAVTQLVGADVLRDAMAKWRRNVMLILTYAIPVMNELATAGVGIPPVDRLLAIVKRRYDPESLGGVDREIDREACAIARVDRGADDDAEFPETLLPVHDRIAKTVTIRVMSEYSLRRTEALAQAAEWARTHDGRLGEDDGVEPESIARTAGALVRFIDARRVAHVDPTSALAKFDSAVDRLEDAGARESLVAVSVLFERALCNVALEDRDASERDLRDALEIVRRRERLDPERAGRIEGVLGSLDALIARRASGA